MTASDDPSLTDTPTLLSSLVRDLSAANACLREAQGWLNQAAVTVHELARREGADHRRQGPPGA